MPLWSGDFSLSSLDEIVKSQSENRAWSKELRLKTTALVNSRLAKQISQDEYALNRKLTHEQAAECQRRAMILSNEIAGRDARLLCR
ncbi:MAG: hypothetical protein ABI165_04205 [Bryobacteraceae bacterium]